ncbi:MULTISPECIES: hypothetical protein [Aliivibrio]|jgi:hypothetical protein|uniref:Uncharacterized protein n=1 Tax=Aliivibrio sifiae TaxID=566293 RepID=A0A2S7X8Q5_9GAMM|nr:MULTISPECIES: hypothetical protein [Aliivibrio]MBB1315760.1 hypothetical protein [Aliivibrio sp. SR45-2]OCH17772.1 hypothetical protein A6E03_19625 [Aliivibrio sp. 1S128]OED54416.1 hypothetical protein BEI47_17125 [Aliivibrio fischeri]PQJ87526.1 hypothetical protein BTO23_15585 [Aliivibrio sifiae]GLR77295.1 hypothetical protein GCM10007855_41700 [Aliivibrio sifiae]
MNSVKTPKIFLYSILLPIIWIAFGLTIATFLPSVQLGAAGLVIILYVTITLICLHFTKSYPRQFTKNEKIRLTAYFILWASLCESLVVLSLGQMELNKLFFILGFTVIVDAILISLGVHFISKRMIKMFLNQSMKAVNKTE